MHKWTIRRLGLVEISLIGLSAVTLGGGLPLGSIIAAAPNSSVPTTCAEVEARLQRRVDVDFRGKPLNEVLQEIAEHAQVNFVVNWSFLEANAITREHQVTLQLQNQSLHHVLSILLEEISIDVHVDFDVRDGVLVVSTAEELGRWMETRVYPVADLLFPTMNAHSRNVHIDPTPPPSLSLHLVRSADQSFREARAMESSEQSSADTRQSDAAQTLIDLITSSVFPDRWVCNCGRNSISAFHGNLIVRANPKVHRELEKLLSNIRAARRNQSF